MKIRRITIITSLLALSISSAFVIGTISTKGIVKASVPTFGISFDSSHNKFFAGTGTTTQSGNSVIKTNLDNDVAFAYSNLAGGSASVWHLVSADGYFYNTDPIHGLESLKVAFTSSDKEYKIYWSNNTTFSETKSATYISDTENVNCDFGLEYPTYFKFVNSSGSNLSIKSMNITLTCLNNYPVLNTYSEDLTMGTVSGEHGDIRSGTTVSIIATPNSGYRFVGWYSNGNLVSTNSVYTFVMGNDDLAYSARFTYESYNLVVQTESIEKGSVSNSSGTYNYLDQITISAQANNGYTFEGWYDGSSLIATDNPYTFSMPYVDTTYTAAFSINSYNLTLVNANSDLGSITGAGLYSYNSSVTVVANPNEGVSFLGWFNENNQVSSQPSYTFLMPYEDLELEARFAWTPYSVTVSINDETMGSVTGAGSYTYGQQVNLVATPNEHHSFFGWYENDALVSQESTLTFNMSSNSKNYSARFVHNYNINAYSDNQSMGTVTAPSEWGAGLSVSVIANYESGYALDYWADENYDELSYDSTYTFVMPEHDIELIAVFTTGYTLTITTNDPLLGSATGAGNYKAGRSVTVVANATYGFKYWTDINNNQLSSNYSYTFVMPSSDYQLITVFKTEQEAEEDLIQWKKDNGVIPVINTQKQTITYGLYPQTNINDSALINSLNDIAAPEENGWYLFENKYYAKTVAKHYEYYKNLKFDNGTVIVDGNTYWFECKPITWKILSNNNGEYYLFASNILDTVTYYSVNEEREIDGQTIYPNNYMHSDIRVWLNGTFFDSAFALDNSCILQSTVDNSGATTIVYGNQYVCDNTFDNVFLPSYQDLANTNYGFSDNSSRMCKPSDYAKATGALTSYNSSTLGNGMYTSRSPHNTGSYAVSCIGDTGNLSGYVNITNEYNGARPAIILRMED